MRRSLAPPLIPCRPAASVSLPALVFSLISTRTGSSAGPAGAPPPRDRPGGGPARGREACPAGGLGGGGAGGGGVDTRAARPPADRLEGRFRLPVDLVARTERPPGRIAALTFGEGHGSAPLGLGLPG